MKAWLARVWREWRGVSVREVRPLGADERAALASEDALWSAARGREMRAAVAARVYMQKARASPVAPFMVETTRADSGGYRSFAELARDRARVSLAGAGS